MDIWNFGCAGWRKYTVGQMGIWTGWVLKLTSDEVKSLRNRITMTDFVDFTRKSS